MDTPAGRLEKKFKRKHRLIESEIGKTQKTALQRLLKEGKVVRVKAYYLAGYEPTVQTESERILQKLLSRPALFPRTALRSRYKESQPFFRSALSKVLTEKSVVSLGVSGTDGEYFIHRDHLVNMLELGYQAVRVYIPPFETASTYWQSILLLTVDELDQAADWHSHGFDEPTQLDAFAEAVLRSLTAAAIRRGVAGFRFRRSAGDSGT
jgi:hypothetical protein